LAKEVISHDDYSDPKKLAQIKAMLDKITGVSGRSKKMADSDVRD